MFRNVPDILSTKQCQELLKVGKNTMLELLKSKKILAFKIGSRWKIPKESVIEYAKKHDDDIFIIGGSSIYKEFINDSDKMILTEIDAECPSADVYFPKFNLSDWNKEIITENEYKNLSYRHVLYKRKK